MGRRSNGQPGNSKAGSKTSRDIIMKTIISRLAQMVLFLSAITIFSAVSFQYGTFLNQTRLVESCLLINQLTHKDQTYACLLEPINVELYERPKESHASVLKPFTHDISNPIHKIEKTSGICASDWNIASNNCLIRF